MINTSNVAPVPPHPTEAEIRAYAHQLYIHSGWVAGRDLENWLEAEAYLTAVAQQAPSRVPATPRARSPVNRPRARARRTSRAAHAKATL